MAPVEETDKRGRKRRTTRNKDTGRGTPQGAPISLPGDLAYASFSLLLGWDVRLDRMTDITQIFLRIEQGDSSASDQLLPVVYDELRRLASQLLSQENPGQTLQPTALVHEAYVRLTGKNGQKTNWDNRGHFFSAAATAMRRLLVENARRKNRLKHGGKRKRVSLEAAESLLSAPCEDLLALDEVLTRLTDLDPIKAEVVKLRFYAGLTMPEVAKSLDLSLATAERYWTFARTWLYAELTEADSE